ncbi:MAG: endonuclease NucS domain-containing protein [Terriglobales bacterium]
MPLESEIRDWIAANLDFLESGLELIKKEQYLPSGDGAAGFIDVFAKDSEGHIVVIEIKRAERAAREAITELAKYAALLRNGRKLRKSEIRFIVVSTVWDQLLVPFSEWVDSTDYNVLGFRVTANADGSLSSKVAVQPAHLDAGRVICRRQFVQYYKDGVACDAAEPVFSRMSQACGIEDYLIFRVKVTGENVYGVTRALIYAQQKHDKEFYVKRLRARLEEEEFDELMSYTEDLDLDDAVDELADHLPTFDQIPR